MRTLSRSFLHESITISFLNQLIFINETITHSIDTFERNADFMCTCWLFDLFK